MKLHILQGSQWLLFHNEQVLGFNKDQSVRSFSAAVNQTSILCFLISRFSMMLPIKLKTVMI